MNVRGYRGFLLGLAISAGCSSSGDDDGGVGPDADTGEPADAAPADAAPPATPQPLVYYLYDIGLEAVVVMRDENDDGDVNDDGERGIFFDNRLPTTGIGNSQGLWVAPDGALFASDNISTSDEERDQNVVRLFDENGDGDALDPGESSVFYDGRTPGGGHIDNPTCLSPGADGALYLIDNNYNQPSPPTAMYRLRDADGDGEIAAGESSGSSRGRRWSATNA